MKSSNFGYLFLINTIVLFSTYEVVSKTIIGKVDPFQINFLRFFFGGILLFLFSLIKGDIRISGKNLAVVVLLGVINVIFSMNFLQLSLNTPGAKASVVAVIFSSNPIFVAVFAALIDKERIHLYKIAGLIIGVTGIIVISINGLDIRGVNIKSPLMAVVSAVLYGLYTVIGRKVSSRIGSLKMNSYSFLAGSILLLPFLMFFNIPVMNFDSSAVGQVIYLSVFVTGIAYLTYFKGLTFIGASKGSLVFFLKPVLASIFAIIFLGEQITVNLVSGTALIIISILIILYWKEFKIKSVLSNHN